MKKRCFTTLGIFVPAVLGAFPCCVALLFGKPQIQEEHVYYTVSGNNLHEIKASLLAESKRNLTQNADQTALGTADCRIKPEFDCVQKGGNLTVKAVNTTVIARITMPRWSSAKSGMLYDRWQSFLKALERHERRHRDIAINGAMRLERELQAFSAPAKVFKAQLKNRANKIGYEVEREQAKYDNSYNDPDYTQFGPLGGWDGLSGRLTAISEGRSPSVAVDSRPISGPPAVTLNDSSAKTEKDVLLKKLLVELKSRPSDTKLLASIAKRHYMLGAYSESCKYWAKAAESITDDSTKTEYKKMYQAAVEARDRRKAGKKN